MKKITFAVLFAAYCLLILLSYSCYTPAKVGCPQPVEAKYKKPKMPKKTKLY